MKVELDLPDRPITPEEFAQMDEPDGWHLELWKGNLLLMSPYTRWHERIKRRIATMLENRSEVADTERGVVCPDGSVPIANVGVLSEDLEVRPVRGGRHPGVLDRRPAPDR
jgi:Uma2 family endonuclease